MATVAVCLAGARGRRIVGELEDHGHVVRYCSDNTSELESALAGSKIVTVIVSADRKSLTPGVLSACDSAGVRVVAFAASESDRRNAASLGLRDVVDSDADWARIEDALEARWDEPMNGVTASGTSGNRHSQVIAVWGPAGAPGRTTVAIALAAELAGEGFSVALVDADTHSGAIAPTLALLDEAPGFAAACRLAGADGLSISEFERVSERYISANGSFWVLTGIGRPHRWPELSGDRVTATIAACREWVDFTIIDTGFSLENDEEISSDLFAPRRNAATISALRAADRVLAVGSGDPVGLSRFLRAHVDLLEVVEPERVLIVMNRIRVSAIGSSPSTQIQQTLRRFGGIVAPELIPYDQAALDAAILAGKTLRDAAPKSGPRLAVSKIVATHFLRQESRRGSGRVNRNRRELAN